MTDFSERHNLLSKFLSAQAHRTIRVPTAIIPIANPPKFVVAMPLYIALTGINQSLRYNGGLAFRHHVQALPRIEQMSPHASKSSSFVSHVAGKSKRSA